MTERDRTPDLARAVAAFNDETRDNIALALWMEELDENQTVELQFAISEAGGRHFQAEPIVLPATSGLVDYQTDPFVYRLGRNTIECHCSGEFFPVTIKAWGLDRGAKPRRTLSIDLTFSSGKETLLQGDAGCMPSVDGIGSLYYSIPNLQLDPAVGTLRLDDETITLECGVFWFAPHAHAYAEVYQQTGDTPPAVMSVAVAGAYMAADKATGIIRGTLEVTAWIKADRSPDPARYLVTDTWYPNGWAFRFAYGVPEDIRTFTMTPIVREAQSGFFANGAQYAEGAVILRNADGREIGRGFAESVSYADTRRTAHRLAGLDESAASIAALRPRKVPLARRLANALYVMAHNKELAAIIGEAAGLELFVKT